jgi:hypothetical protein
MELTLHRLTNNQPGAVYDEIVRLCTGTGAGDLMEIVIHLADAMAAVMESECGSREAAVEVLRRQLAEAEQRLDGDGPGDAA